MLRTLNFTLFYDLRENARQICVRIYRKYNDYLLIHSFWYDTAASYQDIFVLYSLVEPEKYQVYVLFA